MQNAELVAKSEDLNLKCGAVAERSQNGRKTTLRKPGRATIDVRGAKPHCINQIQIYENDRGAFPLISRCRRVAENSITKRDLRS
jgi:hypothetical protein